MECLGCGTEIPYSTWKTRCLPCYKESKRESKSQKHDPCQGCGGEDCICCEVYAEGSRSF